MNEYVQRMMLFTLLCLAIRSNEIHNGFRRWFNKLEMKWSWIARIRFHWKFKKLHHIDNFRFTRMLEFHVFILNSNSLRLLHLRPKQKLAPLRWSHQLLSQSNRLNPFSARWLARCETPPFCSAKRRNGRCGYFSCGGWQSLFMSRAVLYNVVVLEHGVLVYGVILKVWIEFPIAFRCEQHTCKRFWKVFKEQSLWPDRYLNGNQFKKVVPEMLMGQIEGNDGWSDERAPLPELKVL